VVASGIMGIPELITSGANGLLVPPADATALADAIGALADDPDLRIRLGAAGRERVLREHDLSASAQRLAGMFEEMLGPEPAAGEARRPRALRMSAGALASSETAPP
jgi:glycosyltransferase involved in cell wall biosynthesis